MKNIILQLIFIMTFFNCYSQTKERDYSKFINQYRVYEPRTIKRKNTTEKIVYLGELKLKDSLYYLITSFKTVKAALVDHGHSTVYILDSNKKNIKTYLLDAPEQIPFKLEDNSLYFNYLDEMTKTNKVFIYKIEDKIPELLCVDPTFEECY